MAIEYEATGRASISAQLAYGGFDRSIIRRWRHPSFAFLVVAAAIRREVGEVGKEKVRITHRVCVREEGSERDSDHEKEGT